MTIDERVQKLIERFDQYNDWEERYKELIKLGRELDTLEEHYHVDKFQVKGCQSQVWLVPSLQSGIVKFKADSDAILVRGIVGILVKVYSNSSPDEILDYKDDFLQKIGITEHLSMNRTNGLASMLKQIKMYAVAYKSLVDKGIKDAPNL